MASDSDYTAFLDKANRQRDAGSGEAHAEQSEESSRQIRTTAVTHGVKVPEVLKKVDAFYVSDSDEPFEPVALKWAGAASKKWPSSGIDLFFVPLVRIFRESGLSHSLNNNVVFS